MIAVTLPVLLGVAALTIDVGMLYNTRSDLQITADAAALGATNILSANQDEDSVEEARAEALAIVRRHSTFGHGLDIDPSDIVFGKVECLGDQFGFTPTEIFPDGVQIRMRATSESVNGAVPLYFSWIFGKTVADVSASATAGLTGMRDMAVVIDLSGSMKHDSYLRFYDVTPINARDVWASLNGPEPSRPYVPGEEDETEYAGDTGPTIGAMMAWGNSLTPVGSYAPTTDPGLWYIPNNAPCALAAVTASLTARGYTAGQRNTLMNSSNSSTWPNRAAVMIGVATWTPSSGSDTSVGTSELTWIPYPPYRKTWTWPEYVDWVAGNNNKLILTHPAFRFRFGLKTYVDFLLDRKDNFSQTDLTKTPEEPMRSVKDGLQEMVNMARCFDQMSLSVFGSTGHHEINLTSNLQAVADRLYDMQPNHYDNSTNIGDGLQLAIDELTSPRARSNAHKIIVLMSDGAHTVGSDPLVVAEQAVDLGIRIYSISVGYIADRDLMIELAEMTGGQEFYASGTPAEYTVQLRDIFRTIGGLGYALLIQ